MLSAVLFVSIVCVARVTQCPRAGVRGWVGARLVCISHSGSGLRSGRRAASRAARREASVQNDQNARALFNSHPRPFPSSAGGGRVASGSSLRAHTAARARTNNNPRDPRTRQCRYPTRQSSGSRVGVLRARGSAAGSALRASRFPGRRRISVLYRVQKNPTVKYPVHERLSTR